MKTPPKVTKAQPLPVRASVIPRNMSARRDATRYGWNRLTRAILRLYNEGAEVDTLQELADAWCRAMAEAGMEVNPVNAEAIIRYPKSTPWRKGQV